MSNESDWYMKWGFLVRQQKSFAFDASRMVWSASEESDGLNAHQKWGVKVISCAAEGDSGRERSEKTAALWMEQTGMKFVGWFMLTDCLFVFLYNFDVFFCFLVPFG